MKNSCQRLILNSVCYRKPVVVKRILLVKSASLPKGGGLPQLRKIFCLRHTILFEVLVLIEYVPVGRGGQVHSRWGRGCNFFEKGGTDFGQDGA